MREYVLNGFEWNCSRQRHQFSLYTAPHSHNLLKTYFYRRPSLNNKIHTVRENTITLLRLLIFLDFLALFVAFSTTSRQSHNNTKAHQQFFRQHRQRVPTASHHHLFCFQSFKALHQGADVRILTPPTKFHLPSAVYSTGHST